MQPIEEFTSRIKSLREDNDLRQKQVAQVLEITQQQYSLYEKGYRLMPVDLIKKLAKYYNVDMNYIVGISTIKNPYPKK